MAKFQFDGLTAIKMYMGGAIPKEIAKVVGSSRTNILNLLHSHNIPIRPASEGNRKYWFNQNYFEKIDTKDKAYFLGWLVSDGHNKGDGFRLSIQNEDKNILETFKKYLNHTVELSFVKSDRQNIKDKCYLDAFSVKMSEDLSKLGVVPNKTFITYFPNIPEYLWSHFIRGVFDGDGCIYLNDTHSSFSIVGTEILLQKIQEVLIKECNLNDKQLYKTHCKGISRLLYGGRNQLKKIRDWLYKDCEDLFLERKREKFNKI